MTPEAVDTLSSVSELARRNQSLLLSLIVLIGISILLQVAIVVLKVAIYTKVLQVWANCNTLLLLARGEQQMAREQHEKAHDVLDRITPAVSTVVEAARVVTAAGSPSGLDSGVHRGIPNGG